MATRTVEESVRSLSRRDLVQPTVLGGRQSSAEAAAVIEAAVSSLVSVPRSVLVVERLAANALVAAANAELSAVAALAADADDVLNPAFEVTDDSNLVRARGALSRLESGTSVLGSSADLARFSKSVLAHAEKQLARSVRRRGSDSMVRPSSEATAALRGDLDALVSAHADVVSRADSLAVGIRNFLSAPTSTLLGTARVSRARADIDDILLNGAESRDVVTRTFSAVSAVKLSAERPSVSGPILDTISLVPDGMALSGTSDPSAPSVTSASGPFVLGAGATATVSVGSSLGPFGFPQTGFDLADSACIVGSQVTFPVTVPAGRNLFLRIGTSEVRIPLTAGSRTAAQVAADVNTVLGPSSSAEFCKPGTGRLIVKTSSPSITVRATWTDPATGVVHDSSAHALLGFQVGDTGSSGSTVVQVVEDALRALFGTLVAVGRDGQKVVLTSLDDSVGVQMTVSAPAALAVSGTFRGESASFRLHGTVPGSGTVDPVDPRPLVDPGDIVSAPTGSGVVGSRSGIRVVLSSSVPTFDGSITVTSALDSPHDAVAAAVAGFGQSLSSGRFSAGLSAVEGVVARLSASRSRADSNALKAVLSELSLIVTALRDGLTAGLSVPPPGSGVDENAVVENVLAAFSERGFDRARDMFLSCDLVGLLALDDETASKGGELTAAASEVGKSELLFPDPDDDEDPTAVESGNPFGRGLR